MSIAHITRFAARAALVTVLLTGAALVGCASLTDIAAAREHAAVVARHADAHAADLRTRLNEADPGSPASRALAQDLARAEHARDAVRDALAAADAAINAATNSAHSPHGPPSDATLGDPERTGTAVGTLAALLPEPVRLPVALGTALVLSLARARQLKQAAASIAKSVDLAARADPDLRDRLEASATTLRSAQTPTAGRIVDEATGTKPMLKLPV